MPFRYTSPLTPHATSTELPSYFSLADLLDATPSLSRRVIEIKQSKVTEVTEVAAPFGSAQKKVWRTDESIKIEEIFD